MPRTNDPLRMLTACLIGAGWRTAPWEAERAYAELRAVGDRAPELAAQACADAARFWSGRAATGMIDVPRGETAASRLRDLAAQIAGHDVAPSALERNVTVDPALLRGRL